MKNRIIGLVIFCVGGILFNVIKIETLPKIMVASAAVIGIIGMLVILTEEEKK